ncbi:response regulator transcription factor [Ktedonosporobacter rubrisoli]|uniref:Response regulator transcription factor n=1 Tax=Ktedonosporobacter rubrisoli TaxID=2509675 RepID=A0A4V0YYM2_KTERU|nr:response regulator transcription factor [Ktedonosporobacter rubrisoli]QBD76711.1 response regulator transcription factor [Ktedonosporobacter rubrisoli]
MEQTNAKLRILLADDHPLFRHGLLSLLQAQADFEVVGEAVTGEDAVRQAEQLQPDIILMDIRMPGMNGIEATRRILHINPHIRILVITMFEDDASVFAAMKAGVLGYVLKDAQKNDILRAIRAVGSGEAIFGPAIALRLMNFFATSLPESAAPELPFPDLTRREREILELIAQGLSNTEIAERLVLSHNTVRNYVSNIFSKLQVADRAQAIVLAREAHLK